MAGIFYGLCAFTALLCAVLLFRAYSHGHYRLLLWGALCFSGLTLNNLLVVVDNELLPDINLFTPRLVVALASILIMIYGLIFDTE